MIIDSAISNTTGDPFATALNRTNSTSRLQPKSVSANVGPKMKRFSDPTVCSSGHRPKLSGVVGVVLVGLAIRVFYRSLCGSSSSMRSKPDGKSNASSVSPVTQEVTSIKIKGDKLYSIPEEEPS